MRQSFNITATLLMELNNWTITTGFGSRKFILPWKYIYEKFWAEYYLL